MSPDRIEVLRKVVKGELSISDITDEEVVEIQLQIMDLVIEKIALVNPTMTFFGVEDGVMN